MSSSDLKRRPISGKVRDEAGLSDNTRNGPKTSDNHSLLKTVEDIDVYLTYKLGLCADSSSPLGFLRPLMVLLEWSGHGVPWFSGTILAVLISHDRDMLEIFLNLLAGMYSQLDLTCKT